MNNKSFFKLVEIQTKVASMLPFITGALFCFYRYRIFNIVNTLLFLISLLSIDMATTALNNYMDFKRAIVKEGYNYEHHNAIVAYDLTIKQVRLVITFLIILATIIGIILALRTDIVVLLLGILSFGAGILYSFGPVPISRTPLGEAFSGLFMGGLIFFITVYIQAYHLDIVVFSYIEGNLILNFSIKELIPIMIASFPMIAGIANIMLANNLCDLPEDIENKRYTLPYYIGEERGIKLFALLYYLSYVAIIIGVILKALPLICLLVLLTFPFLYKGIKRFKEVQKKESTFVIAVQNFTLFSISYAFTLVIGLLIF